ncbi:MAG: acetylxylan esterase [Acidobacteria bacterium]|nr:acetylxylan esterase [Acidobacteriota bacterium]
MNACGKRCAVVAAQLVVACLWLCGAAWAQDTSNPAGRWYVLSGSQRMTFRFDQQGAAYLGVRLDDANKVIEQFDNVSWTASTRTLEFRRTLGNNWQWYRGRIVEGLLNMRYSSTTTLASKPTDWLAYKWHLTGWNHEYLTPALAPQAFDLQIVQTGVRARLHIDRSTSSPSGFEGRLKVYAVNESCSEQLEEDFVIERWNGTLLRFTVKGQTYEGTVSGRTITGTLQQTGAPVYQFRGARAEVLSYGFAGKTMEERSRWQLRARKQLYHLALAGNPAALTSEVRETRAQLPPLLGVPDKKRDDNASSYPQTYTLTELSFRWTLPNPNGGAPLERLGHGYLAKPTNGTRGGGRDTAKYPLALVVNGHTGSAWQAFDPSSQLFWYGDAFARQGYIVLAVDISHRPKQDRIRYGTVLSESLGYDGGYEQGDDPAHGNVVKPSIKPALPPVAQDAPLYTDWEEDGERAWDAMRALDYALKRPDVDAARVVVAGLSLGGEISSYIAALDPRVTVGISAGFSPDLNVLKYNFSHGCWNWSYADIREYIDASDLLALVAPRPMIIETGKLDPIYACSPAFFAGDKQVARRARAAYGADARFLLHYLHNDGHYFRVGDLNAPEAWLRVPARITPSSLGDTTWQTDSTTYSPNNWTLFRHIGVWFGFRYLQ